MRPSAAGAADLVSRKPFPASRLRGFWRAKDGKKTTATDRQAYGGLTLARWCKFNLVGAVGIFVQVTALFFLKSVAHSNYLAATAFAVEAAVVHNFLWHERFTWADRVRPSWGASLRRLARFNLTTGAVSIAGNLGLMRVMVGMGHMNYLAANAVAIALCSLANFLVSEEWVFLAADPADLRRL